MSKEVLSRITESISNRVTEAMDDPAHKELPAANLAIVIANIAAFECASQLVDELEQRDQRLRQQASRLAKLEAALTREGIGYE